MRLILAAIFATTACIEPTLVPCGDKLCPGGTQCVGDELCATPDQLAACAGSPEGASCSLNGGIGRCHDTVCVAAGCGNSVVDPGEQCDDGNATSGDGCRADCQKIEMCGDAILDDGEACDDGNDNAADGCDHCIATEWTPTVVNAASVSASSISLFNPTHATMDHQGNLYIADTSSQRVRRIDVAGIVTTVAGVARPDSYGTIEAGFSGDGGPGTSAQLDTPHAVAVDGLGNVYIGGGNRLRRVDSHGTIDTIAGGGTGGDGSPAVAASIDGPDGVAVDGLGTIYLGGGTRVRKIDTNGIITTIAGTTTAGFNGDGPATTALLSEVRDLALDDAGNIYLIDLYRVRRIDTTGVIATIGGTGLAGDSGDNGPATSARMWPEAITVGHDGTVYVAEKGNARVRRINPNGVIQPVAGTGVAGFSGDGAEAILARLNDPSGIALDEQGRLFVVDSSNSRIRRIEMGAIDTFAGGDNAGFTNDGGAATSALVSYPDGVGVDELGNVYIADTDANRVRRIDTTGVITTIAGNGTPGASGDNGPAREAQLSQPTGVVARAGVVYIADSANCRIRRVDAGGTITTVAGTGSCGSSGNGGPAIQATLLAEAIALDGNGNLLIADEIGAEIRRVDATGTITAIAGGGTGGDGGLATAAHLGTPVGIAVDAAGNLYIADRSDHAVRRVDTTGVISTRASGFTPEGIAVGGGNVYVGLPFNQKVARVEANGTLSTVAGAGGAEFQGDGGAAIDADLDTPRGVAVDATGNLFIADTYNVCVRRVDPAGTITTVAGLVDPDGMGPLDHGRLADPQALVVTPSIAFVAGGSSGTVQTAGGPGNKIEAVVGRYPQRVLTGTLARFRDPDFGVVSGVAYDAADHLLFLTESTANRIQVVALVDPAKPATWTIAPLANAAGTAGFADGSVATAMFRGPTGLYYEDTTHHLLVADTGNHVVRAIDLSAGLGNATVATIAGMSQTRGYFGDGGAATSALLFEPRAITRCANGDLFIADTGNNRIRRVASNGTISTVLGVGVASSSGEGSPSSSFPIDSPLGVACDDVGNVFATSSSRIRLLPADAAGVVDGTGPARTIYGLSSTRFPDRVTRCLTGLAVIDSTTLETVDSCTGLLVRLQRNAVAH